jgi:hypothetical protein
VSRWWPIPKRYIVALLAFLGFGEVFCLFVCVCMCVWMCVCVCLNNCPDFKHHAHLIDCMRWSQQIMESDLTWLEMTARLFVRSWKP